MMLGQHHFYTYDYYCRLCFVVYSRSLDHLHVHYEDMVQSIVKWGCCVENRGRPLVLPNRKSIGHYTLLTCGHLNAGIQRAAELYPDNINVKAIVVHIYIYMV